MVKKDQVETMCDHAIVREVTPPVNPLLEGRFIRGNIMNTHNTVYQVVQGKKYAFTSWQELEDAFGRVPPGGVLVLNQHKVDAIPDGGLWRDREK